MKSIILSAALVCAASFTSFGATPATSATAPTQPKEAEAKRPEAKKLFLQDRTCVTVKLCSGYPTLCWSTDAELDEAIDCAISDWCGL